MLNATKPAFAKWRAWAGHGVGGFLVHSFQPSFFSTTSPFPTRIRLPWVFAGFPERSGSLGLEMEVTPRKILVSSTSARHLNAPKD